VNIFRFVTVSDEAFVRWTLEIKRPKLLEEENNGWPLPNGGRKPPGMHDSRQYSQRYAAIHQEIKKLRTTQNVQNWNNLFWSMYRYVQPKFFEDPSSLTSDSYQGFNRLQHPDEDEYDPDNDNNVETKVFSFQSEENPEQLKEVLTGII
jgi:hypothetical protein